jgi:3-deoxy-manno-octulosonate cytidylyltransferase (CMP-KDO synthetase)
MNTVVVIPARYASTRLPGKPLVMIAGVPMIVRTWRRCVEVVDRERVWVATDDQRIADVCGEHDIQCRLTSEDCLTGTDRIAEFAEQVVADCYINVQGDEPLFNPADLTTLLSAVEEHPGEVMNGYCPIRNVEDFESTAVPKVVFRPDGRLLYMSRRGLPGNKAGEFRFGYRQVGTYAFPAEALQQFAAQKTKTPLEAEEDIEILRFLELGGEVRMVALSEDSVAVDLPEHVERVEAILAQRGEAST